jgi:hypothetical protein
VLKFTFWSLLCLNAVLFAFGQGYLGNVKLSEREPARIAKQFNTDKLQLLSGAAVAARPAVVTPPAPLEAPPEPVAEAAPVLVACTEFNNVVSREAGRLDKLLAPLALGTHMTRHDVTTQEISGHMVMIPPLGSKEAADKKAAELKELGVSNFFIMNDSSPFKWAISLGFFKSEAAAQTLLAALGKQGVSGAKVVGRPSASARQSYRFRNIDAPTKAKLDAIAAKFDDIDTRSCK